MSEEVLDSILRLESRVRDLERAAKNDKPKEELPTKTQREEELTTNIDTFLGVMTADEFRELLKSRKVAGPVINEAVKQAIAYEKEMRSVRRVIGSIYPKEYDKQDEKGPWTKYEYINGHWWSKHHGNGTPEDPNRTVPISENQLTEELSKGEWTCKNE